MADLDAARLYQVRRRYRAGVGVVLVVGGSVEAGPAIHQRLQVFIVVDVRRRRLQRQQVPVAIDMALARLGEDDELVAQIAADGAGLRLHRDRLQAQARKGTHIGHEHLVVGVAGAVIVDVEGIVVFHQELAPAHDAEAGADLVPELPLDVIEILRQVLVAVDLLGDDGGDLLLVGGAVEHVALVPVLDAQHLLAVIFVAPRLAPQIGRLNGRHQHLLGTGPVLLLAHDLLDALEDAETQGQPGIDAGARLAHHAGAQHQPVGDDLRLRRRLLERGQEILRAPHWPSEPEIQWSPGAWPGVNRARL